MARLAASTDPKKDTKLADASARFAGTMSSLRKDLTAITDRQAAIRVALAIDTKADVYQKVFAQGALHGRPNVRLALLSLDQVSVQALEVLVMKQDNGSNVLPEAELSSTVGSHIDTFAAHVAAAPNEPTAARAEIAVAEAKALWVTGDFQAAVRKVIEGADLAALPGDATSTPVSATGTSQTK